MTISEALQFTNVLVIPLFVYVVRLENRVGAMQAQLKLLIEGKVR